MVSRSSPMGGQVVQPDRAAAELEEHGFQQLAVHQVEADRVHVQHHQGGVGHRG
jgi:hypothetical protein